MANAGRGWLRSSPMSHFQLHFENYDIWDMSKTLRKRNFRNKCILLTKSRFMTRHLCSYSVTENKNFIELTDQNHDDCKVSFSFSSSFSSLFIFRYNFTLIIIPCIAYSLLTCTNHLWEYDVNSCVIHKLSWKSGLDDQVFFLEVK